MCDISNYIRSQHRDHTRTHARTHHARTGARTGTRRAQTHPPDGRLSSAAVTQEKAMKLDGHQALANERASQSNITACLASAVMGKEHAALCSKESLSGTVPR